MTVACGLLLRCGDPPAQPTVHVRLTGIRAAVGSLPYDPSTFSVELVLHGPADASTDAGVVATRAIFWDRSDPFEFVVQIPAGAYGPPTVQVHTLLECAPGRGYHEVILGSATATAGLSVRAGQVTEAPPLSIVADPGYCR